MIKRAGIDEARKRTGIDEARRRAMVVSRVFGSPDGQEALKIMAQLFGGSCYAKGDPYHTAYLEGARDVLLYIQQCTSLTSKEV